MKRMFSLMLCFAMALSLFAVPAHACTVDEDGNVTPCDKVEKNGYCDQLYIGYFDGTAIHAHTNPYYGTKPTQPLVTTKPIEAPAEDDTVELVDKDKYVNSVFMARANLDNVDWVTLTTTYPDGTIGVLDPDTLVWTFTTPDGKVTTLQIDKPEYWRVDGEIVKTDTDEIVTDKITVIDPDTGEIVSGPGKTQYFADVDNNAWYAEAVNAMAASGIINGYDDGLFHPENNVTVGELCTIIYRIGKNEEPTGRAVPDHPEYTHWASYAIWTLYKAAVVYINDDPSLANDYVNRGEAIKAIMSLIDDAGLIDKGTYAKIHEYDIRNAPEIPDWDIIVRDAMQYGQAHSWTPSQVVLAYNYGIINGIDETGTFNPNGTLTRAELCQMLYNAGLTKYTPAKMALPAPGYVGH